MEKYDPILVNLIRRTDDYLLSNVCSDKIIFLDESEVESYLNFLVDMLIGLKTPDDVILDILNRKLLANPDHEKAIQSTINCFKIKCSKIDAMKTIKEHYDKAVEEGTLTKRIIND